MKKEELRQKDPYLCFVSIVYFVSIPERNKWCHIKSNEDFTSAPLPLPPYPQTCLEVRFSWIACRSHAESMPTPCRPHANACRPHAEPCRPHVENHRVFICEILIQWHSSSISVAPLAEFLALVTGEFS